MSDEIEAVELGAVLSLACDCAAGLREFDFERKKAPLYWFPAEKCLFFSLRRPNSSPDGTASRRQLSSFRRWHADEPKGSRIERYASPKPGDWRLIGELARIDYHSEKWGDDQEYTHRSRGGSWVWRAGELWIIVGKIRATTRGLVK